MTTLEQTVHVVKKNKDRWPPRSPMGGGGFASESPQHEDAIPYNGLSGDFVLAGREILVLALTFSAQDIWFRGPEWLRDARHERIGLKPWKGPTCPLFSGSGPL